MQGKPSLFACREQFFLIILFQATEHSGRKFSATIFRFSNFQVMQRVITCCVLNRYSKDVVIGYG